MIDKFKINDLKRTSENTDSILSESLHKPSLNKIYLGIVKDNQDLEKMGRLRVFIPELGGQPGDVLRWYTVDYCSPFAGATDLSNAVSGSKSMNGSQQSYGFWAVPPDIGNLVVVAFINGEPNRGIWLGCLYHNQMNYMVPGIPSGKTFDSQKNTTLPPVVEYNKKLPSINPNDPLRAIFEPLYESLINQGLILDQERGVTTAGARRESPSQVYGIKTPRGHQIYIDDGEIDVDPVTKKPIIFNQEIKRKENSNEFIRLRTRSGVQILLNDTTGYIYLNTKEGNVWVELSDQNGVEIYSNKNINMRTEKDINIHSDNTINFFAENNINFHTEGGFSLFAKEGFDILSENHFKLKSKSIDISVDDNFVVFSKNKISVNSAEILSLTSNKIIQNTIDKQQADKPVVKRKTTINNVQTIVDELPTHEPYPNHPRKLFSPTEEQKKIGNESNERGRVKSSFYGLSKNARSLNVTEDFSENILKSSDCDFILSEKYESNGNPGAIGFDRTGGYSYGSIQIATNTGAMDSFLKFLETEKPEYAKELNNAGGAKAAKEGNPTFTNKWKELAKRDPKEFDTLQKRWNSNVNFFPVKNNIFKKYNIDLNNDPTISAVLYSTATQHGGGGASRIFDRATQGLTTEEIKTMPRDELIKRIYAERGKQDEQGNLVYFKSSTKNVQESVKKRFEREQEDALKMYEKEKQNSLPCKKSE